MCSSEQKSDYSLGVLQITGKNFCILVILAIVTRQIYQEGSSLIMIILEPIDFDWHKQSNGTIAFYYIQFAT